MEVVKRKRVIYTPQLEDIKDMFSRIQSFLPLEEAARTSILSKSWLYAWSTMPSLDLHIVNQESASFVGKGIRPILSKSCLEELSLTILVNIDSFTFQDEFFSGEKLDRLIVKTKYYTYSVTSIPVIRCVYLRVFELHYVNISEDVLDSLLSTCVLLEKINLLYCKGLKTIRVKNLHFLCKLEITSTGTDSLDIEYVPNLRCFIYNTLCWPNTLFNSDSLARVTHLSSIVMTIHDMETFFSMIKEKIPFLETLTLQMTSNRLENLDITCVPLKRLTLRLRTKRHIHVRVFVQSLLLLCYEGNTIPSFSFPTIAPEQIKVTLELKNRIDRSYFRKLRETFNLSSKFDVRIVNNSSDFLAPMNIRVISKCSDNLVPINVDVDDLRRRDSFLAINAQQLSFEMFSDEPLSNHLDFFDAFVTIFHPTYIRACQDIDLKNKYFCKQMVREVMEKRKKGYWFDLKDVKIKNPHTGNWEDLTSYWISFPDETTLGNRYYVDFKLNWYSL